MERSKSSCQVLLAVCFVLALVTKDTAVAAEHSITKSVAPSPVLVLSNSNTVPGVGFANFNVLAVDIPPGTLVDPKQLLEVRWSTTYYPGTLGEDVQLCYYRPFSSQENCHTIFPNSSGALMIFNDQSFDHGAKVTIKHRVLGGARPHARPAGVDSVIFKYQY